MPTRLTGTISRIGLAAAPLLTLARTTQFQSQCEDRSRKGRLSLITDIISSTVERAGGAHSEGERQNRPKQASAETARHRKTESKATSHTSPPCLIKKRSAFVERWGSVAGVV